MHQQTQESVATPHSGIHRKTLGSLRLLHCLHRSFPGVYNAGLSRVREHSIPAQSTVHSTDTSLHIHMSEWLLYKNASCYPLTSQHGGRLMCTTTWVTCGGPKGRWAGRQPSSATARPCALTTPTPPPGGAWGICSGRTASTSRLSPAIRWDTPPPLFWGPIQLALSSPLDFSFAF